jgi:hypothetical protein
MVNFNVTAMIHVQYSQRFLLGKKFLKPNCHCNAVKVAISSVQDKKFHFASEIRWRN